MKGWKNHSRADGATRRRHLLQRLANAKTWQLAVVLLVFMMLAAIFLRLNNLGMTDRRAELLAADKTGDIAKVQMAAKNLQNYVAKHMNTSTGRVALQTLYNRAAQAAIEASRPPDVSADVYQQATDECRPQLFTYGYPAWASCIADKVGTSSVTDLNQNAQTPPDPDAYYVEYALARWSLDAAGITVFICLMLIIVIVLRLIIAIILRIILKFKYKTV